MTRKTYSLRDVLSFSAAAALITGGILAAGPLNPPAGPVTSTYKTLSEVEPRIAINAANTPGDADSLFKITQPGSYYLTGNITGVIGKHGIEIAASGVTLDLNGFDLVGVQANTGKSGVTSTLAGLTNVTVRNGSVRGWDAEGVDLGSVPVQSGHIDRVRSSANRGIGLRIGSNSTLTSSTAYLNSNSGMAIGSSCIITDCSSNDNVEWGYIGGSQCTFTNCTANNNGRYGIATGNGSVLSGCLAFSNTDDGISTQNGCEVSHCAASSGSANGIVVGSSCTVSNCVTYDNALAGILGASGVTVSHCSAYSNGTVGITVADGCTVVNCSARTNTTDGILCVSQCLISGNTSTFNGFIGDGAGIHTTSIDNRIDSNTCTQSDRGIQADASGNFIARNTCTGNTVNWVIAANNKCLVVSGVNAAAINGSAGGISPGSTDPNANFTY